MEKIFITGATGNVGSEVVLQLKKLDHSLILAKLPHEKPLEGYECRDFLFEEEYYWENALKGVTKIFLMRPPHISKIKRDMLPFLEYVSKTGIKQVAFLSVQGVENNKMVPHYDVEKYIKQLKIPYTFIRPSFFMQNLTTTHLEEIRDEKRLFVPAGKGKTNFIDVRDVGEVIAKTLAEDKYINKALTITGEKSYNYYQVMDVISKTLKARYIYKEAGILAFIRFHRKKAKPLAYCLVMAALYSVARIGKADGTTDTAEKILGRKTISLEQFVKDHKSLF